MKTNQLSTEFLKPAKGEKIVNVVGLGPTRKYFNPNDGNISIGVNDIFRFTQVDYLCCIEAQVPNENNIHKPGIAEYSRSNKLKYIIEGSKKVKTFFTDWPDVWKAAKAENIKPFHTISHFDKQKGQLPLFLGGTWSFYHLVMIALIRRLYWHFQNSEQQKLSCTVPILTIIILQNIVSCLVISIQIIIC